MASVDYRPPESVRPFLTADKFANFIVGPVGSTKTTASIVKIAYEASRVAPCRDGVRRSRVAVIRNTRQMLWDTTIPDFLKWFPDGKAGVLMKTEGKFLLKFGDIECEVLFRGLDDSNDVRRLLSLQLSFGMIDELREISPEIYNALTGRLGRYPDKSMNGVGCCDGDGKQIHKVWGATNPPSADDFWGAFIESPPENVLIVRQPSGLSPEADWIEYLPADYYENLCEGKSEDWIDVYVHGKLGRSLQGLPVFRCFDRERHVAAEPLRVMPSTLLIGMDAGLNPTAVAGQLAYDGRLLVRAAITGQEGGMGALRFARERLKPLLANQFPGVAVTLLVDPAAFQRAQTDERTVADILKAEGFAVRPARTNSISARVAAVESYLTRTIDGKPAMLIDPDCGQLIQALRSKYRFKLNARGEADVVPEKSHPWSDYCFPAGTPVLTPRGYVPIERLRTGDTVAVPDGVDVVVRTGARRATRLLRLTFSDGSQVLCTLDHPFAVKGHPCFLPADMLTRHHVISVEEGLWANGARPTRASAGWRAYARSVGASLKRLSGVFGRAEGAIAARRAITWAAGWTMGWSVMGCGSLAAARTRTIGTSAQTSAPFPCTATCGPGATARFPTDTTCTTGTTTPATTASRTSNSSLLEPTAGATCERPSPTDGSTWLQRWSRRVRRLVSGTAVWRGGSGTESTRFASPLTVVRKDYLSGDVIVFNLTTERTHTFYAGPALVHNCDALQYLCLEADGGGIFGAKAVVRPREVKPAPMRLGMIC